MERSNSRTMLMVDETRRFTLKFPARAGILSQMGILRQFDWQSQGRAASYHFSSVKLTAVWPPQGAVY